MERISLNGHCTYTWRVRRVSLKSLKMTWWRERKGKWKEGAIWQKKNWGQEITSSTSQRKPVSEVGVSDPGQCPHLDSALTQETQVVSECPSAGKKWEAGTGWGKKFTWLCPGTSAHRKQRKWEFSLLLMKDTTSSKSSKANTLTEKSQSPIIERLDQINRSHRLLLNPCCVILISERRVAFYHSFYQPK